MEIVVDTNIVFSGLLNSTSGIGKLLIASQDHFQFYTCDYLKTELTKNRAKLKKYSKTSDDKLDELIELTIANIITINEELIAPRYFKKAIDLVSDIDLDDAPFLALAMHLKTKLWTGDKKLAKGLLRKGFDGIIATREMLDIFDTLEKKGLQ